MKLHKCAHEETEKILEKIRISCPLYKQAQEKYQFTFEKIIFRKRIPAYPQRAPNTNRMHVNTQAERALNAVTFGEDSGILLNMLVSTKKRVTSNVIRPGTTLGSTKKLTLN